MNTERSQRGLSLLELIVCLLIVALLASMAGSGFTSLMQRERAKTAVLDLRRLLNFSRYNAIMERQTVTLCAVSEAGDCSPQWRGLRAVVFIDANRNHTLEPGDLVLREEKWPLEGGQVTWRASLGRPYIEFKDSGGTAQNGTFTYCPDSGAALEAAAVIVNRAGRNYVGWDSNGDGIRENSQGQNLSCQEQG